VIYGTNETISLFQKDTGILAVYDPRVGYSTLFHFTPERHPIAVISTPPGVELSKMDNLTTIFFTFQRYGEGYYGSFDVSIPPFFNWSLYGHLPGVVNLTEEPHTILSTAQKVGDVWVVDVLIGRDLFRICISWEKPVEVKAVFHNIPLQGEPTVISRIGNLTLIGTVKGWVHVIENGDIKRSFQLSPPIKQIQPVNLYGGYTHQAIILSGRGSLNLIAGKEDLEEVYSLSGILQGLQKNPERVYLLHGGGEEVIVMVISENGVYINQPYNTSAPTFGEIYALLTATILIALLRVRPTWWLLDGIGVLAGAGLISILGISFAPLPLVILFIALAIYDAIAVYRTKHMLQLAESAVEAQVPVMLVFPRRRGYRLPKSLGLTKRAKRKRDAFFMGLGDVVIPGSLVVSAYIYLPSTPTVLNVPYNILAPMFILLGIFTAHLILLWVLLRGKPQAGLPFLNGGALVGLAIAYLLSLL
ncbi:MAG: hypothetical protein J7L88_02325, partial [Thermoplasmata archaeon]|nr:hypothetical protein [Thermoplasmata archaeon]